MIKLPLSFKTVQLCLPKIRALLSARVVLILALATSLAISAVIKLIQQDADQWRVGQVLLMRLDKRVYQLNALEAQSSADPSMAHSNKSSLDNLNSEAQEYLDQLTQARNDRSALPEVRYNLARYQTALNGEFQLLDVGKAPEARRFHEEQVRPIFEKLTDAIGDANKSYDSQAVFASQVADIGTTTVLLITALGLSLLIRRFERVRRQGAQLTTEREMLRQSEERFRALIRNASDVIAILSPAGEIRYLSSAAQHLWGYAPEDLEGTCVFALMPLEEGARPQALMEQAIESPEGGLTTEMRVQYADQSWHLSEIILTNLLSEPGIEGIVLTCRDISERKAFEEQLSHQAFHDALTGLPNRALFMERLLHAQARARRQQTCVGVVFLDLDNFKVINDSLGHEAGDHLLLTVAQRLSDCIRPGDTVARLGGDEFTVLFEDLTDNDHIVGLAERLVQVMDTPVTVSGREVFDSQPRDSAECRGRPSGGRPATRCRHRDVPGQNEWQSAFRGL
jgi:diguanylate cyclase (GGDEF)-like protein/PAS domain S-box-containing protein